MQEEYLRYWGLCRPPFSLTPDPEMLYMSQQHQECLLRLRYAIATNKGGALLISDQAGDGKTSLLYKLVSETKREFGEESRVAFFSHPVLTPTQMVREITKRLGAERVYREKTRNLDALRELLLARHGKGAKSVVIVDEGQMLRDKSELLEELRTLLNFSVSDSFLLTFILSGQRPLEEAIKSRPEFWQRLPVRFFLRNLDERDTGKLVKHRIRVAGGVDREIFTPEALREVYRYSRGCPRVICSIADMSLVVGFSRRTREVDAPEVSQAHADSQSGGGSAFLYYHFLETRKPPFSRDTARMRSAPARPRASKERTTATTLFQRRIALLPFFSGLPKAPQDSANSLIPPNELRLLYLPRGGFRGNAVLRVGNESGLSILRRKCGVTVSSHAIYFVIGKRIVRLPISELRRVHSERQRELGKGTLVLETPERVYELRLRLPTVQAEALADAMMVYLKARKREKID